jgi:CRP-like cAMP-binding protein
MLWSLHRTARREQHCPAPWRGAVLAGGGSIGVRSGICRLHRPHASFHSIRILSFRLTCNSPGRIIVSTSNWPSARLRAAAVERSLRAGETLCRAGGRTTGLYEVVKGKMRLARLDRSGREAILQVARPGDMFAEASLFSVAYRCDAIAMADAVVRLYPKAIMLAELERDPKLLLAFAAMLARQVMTPRTRLEQRNIHSARDRVNRSGRTAFRGSEIRCFRSKEGSAGTARRRYQAPSVGPRELPATGAHAWEVCLGMISMGLHSKSTFVAEMHLIP